MPFPIMVMFYDKTMPGGEELELDVRRSLKKKNGRFRLGDGWHLVSADMPGDIGTGRAVYLRHESTPVDEAAAAVAELQRS